MFASGSFALKIRERVTPSKEQLRRPTRGVLKNLNGCGFTQLYVPSNGYHFTHLRFSQMF